jgi:hypothetical protein
VPKNVKGKPRRKSRYRGVTDHKGGEKSWRADITHEGRTMYLGCYQAEETAARVFDYATKQLKGDKAPVNFDDVSTLETSLQVQIREKIHAAKTKQKEKRRYNDFVALAMKLRSNRVSLPSMPPKMMSPVGYLLNLNMTRGWISKRQAHLDSFLKRVTCTKKAFESDALLEFLSIDPQHWDAIKQAAGVEVVVTEGDEGAAAK